MGDNFSIDDESFGFHAPEITVVDPSALIAQLNAVVNNPNALKGADAAQRAEIQRLSRAASRTLEQPFDTMMRIMYSPLQLVATRIGQDHNIFPTLAASHDPISLAALSEATRLNTIVLESVLDYLCTQGMARQVTPERYMATKLTHYLDEPLLRSTTIHFHNAVLPGFAALNNTLKDPNTTRTAFQNSFDTDLTYYQWAETHPLEKNAFHHFMEEHIANLPHWLDAFDFRDEFGAGLTDDDVAFVDIGGSIGHQCEALRRRHPNLKGRVILQDLPDVIENALPVPGMEKMSHNYLEEQPIKGARVYYLRQILHNNNDDTCVQILQSILPAMQDDHGSVIAIDDKVLPNNDDRPDPDSPGVEYHTGLSLAMLMFFNAQERREAHWRRLLARAGLAVREIRKFSATDDAVIIAVKA